MRAFFILLFVLFATASHSFRHHRRVTMIQMNSENKPINTITKNIAKFITSGLIASSFFSVPMLVVSSSPQIAYAGFFTSEEQDSIDRISSYQKPVFELLDALRPADIPNAVGKVALTFFCSIPPQP